VPLVDGVYQIDTVQGVKDIIKKLLEKHLGEENPVTS
jgi:hypothetical protein